MSGTLLDHLTAIRDEHGELSPKLVLDSARDPDHPLHSRFEWDDSVAGERYRLDQARQLIRVVKLPSEPGRPSDLRAFVSVRGQDSRAGEYVPTEEAMGDPFTRRLVLSAMEREWKALKARYEHLAEFAAMIEGDTRGKAS